MQSDEIVYFAGKLRAASEVRYAPEDHGVMFGCGFFETFRTSGGRPHEWKRHRDRLFTACERAGIELPPSSLAWFEPSLQAACAGMLRAHGREDAVFRYTVTSGAPGSDGRYRAPTELLSLRALPAESPDSGIALRVLRLTRDRGEWLPRPKSLNYTNALMGARELRGRVQDLSDDGLFLNDDGFAVETTRQNLAWIQGREFFTPALELGAIPGTCLSWVFDQGIIAKFVRARVEEIVHADALMVLNAVRGITPVRAIWDADDRSEAGTFASSEHETVRWLRERWSESLAATASVR